MEEIGILWNYQENIDHVQQKLVCTTLALEAVKKEANDELKKYEECIKYLRGLLHVVCQERDQSRNQLQKLLDNLAGPDGTVVPGLTRANSSITESNNSHASPTVDSFVSSPDSNSRADTTGAPNRFDVIDDLCRGLVLPQKGSLLKVVMDSGPLLSSLLVSGTLPQWKNPPPIQPIKILPFPINVSQASPNMCSTVSMMSFGAGSSRGYQNDDRGLTSAVAIDLSDYAPVAKRQRFRQDG